MRSSTSLLLLALAVVTAGCTGGAGNRSDLPGKDADTVLRRGEGQYLQGQYAASAETFRGFLSRYPGHRREPDAHYWLGCSLLVLEEEGQARSHLETVIASRASDDLKARARGSLGDLARQQMNDAEAVRCYEQASRNNPSGYRQEDYLYWLGLCRIRSGDWSGGRRELEQLVRTYPAGSWAKQARLPLALEGQRFRVQLGAFNAPDGARAEQADLRRKGIAGDILTIRNDGQTRYLLLTGACATYADAVREASRIKEKGVDAFPVP